MVAEYLYKYLVTCDKKLSTFVVNSYNCLLLQPAWSNSVLHDVFSEGRARSSCRGILSSCMKCSAFFCYISGSRHHVSDTIATASGAWQSSKYMSRKPLLFAYCSWACIAPLHSMQTDTQRLFLMGIFACSDPRADNV